MILEEDARQALEVLRAGRLIDIRAGAHDSFVLLDKETTHEACAGVELLRLRLCEVLDPERWEDLRHLGGARGCADARVSKGEDELDIRDDCAWLELSEQGLELDRTPLHAHAWRQPGREAGACDDAACVLYQGAAPRTPSV